MVGGPQGSGINSVAENFASACLRAGLNVFGNIEYHSNIKGEHSFYRLRIEDKEIRSHVDWVDLLIALDKETLFGDHHNEVPTHRGHRHEVTPGGGIICDTETKFTPEEIGRPDVKLFPIPYKDLLIQALKEFGKDKELSKYQVMVNTVAYGAGAGLVDFDFELLAQGILEGFTGRKASLGEINVRAAKIGYDYAKEKFGSDFEWRLTKTPIKERQMLIRGVAAVGIAKFKAGCALQTYYPITPATDESDYLESHQKDYNIVVMQTEDEISAFLMAAGAAHAGVRAATSTSGPGFSLMAEGLGWSGITEAPGPVVIIYQRTGPSTGLPTRTEQGDLRFAIHASHGESPRIVLAPGDVAECFYDTFDSFNYAERYQVPVIILADKYLASSYRSVPIFNGDLKVDRGKLLTDQELANIQDYKRYQFTQFGISSRSIPGQKGGIFWTTGDEHDERGHINESGENRVKMMQKRMRKLEIASDEIPDSRKIGTFGPDTSDATVVSWGSTQGAILDAMEVLAGEGIRLNFIQVRLLNPFPTKLVADYLSNSKRRIIVENNYSAQLAGLVREHTGYEMDHRIVKFDGRPFSQNELYESIKNALQRQVKEVIVSHA